MKKLILILTVILGLFAGNQMAQGAPEEQPNILQYAHADADGNGSGEKPKPEPEPEPKKAAETPPPATWESDGDSGDTAWMIVATALVLLMTIPGLSLFYSGLVGRKNVLSVLVQCFAITCVMTILWVAFGYGWSAEAENDNGLYYGELGNRAFLSGLTEDSASPTDAMSGTMPESVWITFQMTFAIITPALIIGAFVERMKFSAILIFTSIWFAFSYLPVWHMAWGGGLFHGGADGNWLMGAKTGAIDFAGGTVVHINAGVAALVGCLLLRKRKKASQPHNVPFVVIGASLLWVGWFGFNAGSAGGSNGGAGMALLVTQVATAVAAFSWMLVEWCVKGKATAVGIATGAVAGLVAITPASGNVGPLGAIVIGIGAGVICYFAATTVKKALGYDDSLDVFGVHGIGGIVGCIFAGFCAYPALQGFGDHVEGTDDIIAVSQATQVWIQAKSCLLTIVWSGVVAFVAIKIAGLVCGGLEVDEEAEDTGLDVTDHGEEGYQL
tara:strand:+ start:125 stop:1621 length:1497 start_codon:yes stop_codon:yes gene_type:complete